MNDAVSRSQSGHNVCIVILNHICIMIVHPTLAIAFLYSLLSACPWPTLSLENRNCLLPICSSFPVLMTHNTYLERISLWKTIKMMALFNMKQHKPHFDCIVCACLCVCVAKRKTLGNSSIDKVSVL